MFHHSFCTIFRTQALFCGFLDVSTSPVAGWMEVHGVWGQLVNLPPQDHLGSLWGWCKNLCDSCSHKLTQHCLFLKAGNIFQQLGLVLSRAADKPLLSVEDALFHPHLSRSCLYLLTFHVSVFIFLLAYQSVSLPLSVYWFVPLPASNISAQWSCSVVPWSRRWLTVRSLHSGPDFTYFHLFLLLTQLLLHVPGKLYTLLFWECHPSFGFLEMP